MSTLKRYVADPNAKEKIIDHMRQGSIALAGAKVLQVEKCHDK